MRYTTVTLAAVIVFLVSEAAQAQLADLPHVVYEDTFSHDEGFILRGTLPEIGPEGEEWSSLVTHEIFEGKANFRDVANSADVKYLAPTDRKFSVEAVASERDVGGALTPNHNIALGFADSTPNNPDGFQPEVPPGQNISGRTSLTLGIDGGGGIYLWENSFNKQVASGMTLTDAGLALDFQGDIPMKLEMDPVNDRAVALVNNVIVYDIDFDIDSDSTCDVGSDPCRYPITWAGFGWSGPGRIQGAWDDFRIREEPGIPTGACDLPGGETCEVLTEAQCTTQGGSYLGDGALCGPSTFNIPGDCNQDGALDLSDVICLLGHLFQGTPATLPCTSEAANLALMDCNRDGGVDLSDAIYKLAFLFQGGPPPDQGEGCVGMEDCPQNTSCP